MSVITFFFSVRGFLCSSPGFLCCRFSLLVGFGLVCAFFSGLVFSLGISCVFQVLVSLKRSASKSGKKILKKGRPRPPVSTRRSTGPTRRTPLSAAYTDIHRIPSSSSDRPTRFSDDYLPRHALSAQTSARTFQKCPRHVITSPTPDRLPKKRTAGEETTKSKGGRGWCEKRGRVQSCRITVRVVGR